MRKFEQPSARLRLTCDRTPLQHRVKIANSDRAFNLVHYICPPQSAPDFGVHPMPNIKLAADDGGFGIERPFASAINKTSSSGDNGGKINIMSDPCLLRGRGARPYAACADFMNPSARRLASQMAANCRNCSANPIPCASLVTS